MADSGWEYQLGGPHGVLGRVVVTPDDLGWVGIKVMG